MTGCDAGRVGDGRAALVLAVAALLALPAGASAEGPAGKPAPGVRFVAGECFRVRLREQQEVTFPTAVPSVERLVLEREALLTILSVPAEGGAQVRMRYTRIHGAHRLSALGPGEVTFDTADPERGPDKAPITVAGRMRDIGTSVEFSVTPRCVVGELRRPADGSLPHVLFDPRYTPTKWSAEEARSDVQKLFAILPESTFASGKTWTTRHDMFQPPLGWNLGPFTLRSRAEASGKGDVKTFLTCPDTKRPARKARRSEDAENVALRDEPLADHERYGPFEFQATGSETLDRESLVTGSREVKLALKQLQRPAVPLAVVLEIAYECTVQWEREEPAKGPGEPPPK